MFPRRTLALVLLFAPAIPAVADLPAETEPDTPARSAADTLHPPVRLADPGGPIDSGPAWGHSGPTLADLDADGLADLVVGDFSGTFTFYKNTGTQHEPRYAAGVKIRAGNEDATVPIY
jgi:hypothetical protein